MAGGSQRLGAARWQFSGPGRPGPATGGHDDGGRLGEVSAFAEMPGGGRRGGPDARGRLGGDEAERGTQRRACGHSDAAAAAAHVGTGRSASQRRRRRAEVGQARAYTYGCGSRRTNRRTDRSTSQRADARSGGKTKTYRYGCGGHGSMSDRPIGSPADTPKRSRGNPTKLFDTKRSSDASNSLMASNHPGTQADSWPSSLSVMTWVQATVVPNRPHRET